MPASLPFGGPVGVTHTAGVDRGDDARHSQGRADFDLGNYRAISTAILVAGESEAAPARTIALFACFPSSGLRDRLDHLACPRVLQMTQSELDRIGVGGSGELVDERLDREDVGERSERAQCRNPERHIGYKVVADFLRREVVEGDRVPIRAPGRLRYILGRWQRKRRIHVPGSKKGLAFAPPGPPALRMAPAPVLPTHHST